MSSTVTTWIGWVQKSIDNYINSTFSGTSETRYYDTNGSDSITIEDFTSVTEISFLDAEGDVEETLTTDDYWLYPLNTTTKNEIRLSPVSSHPNFGIGSRRLKVTGVFETESTVPADIEWVATSMVGDIYNQQTDKGRVVTSMSLGEYSVSWAKLTDNPIYRKVLDGYRVPVV